MNENNAGRGMHHAPLALAGGGGGGGGGGGEGESTYDVDSGTHQMAILLYVYWCISLIGMRSPSTCMADMRPLDAL